MPSRRGPFLACVRKIQLSAWLLFARRGPLWALSLWKLCGAESFFKLSRVQGSSALPLRQNLVPKLISKIFPAVVESRCYRPRCCICLPMLSRRYFCNSLGFGTLMFFLFHCSIVLFYSKLKRRNSKGSSSVGELAGKKNSEQCNKNLRYHS